MYKGKLVRVINIISEESRHFFQKVHIYPETETIKNLLSEMVIMFKYYLTYD